jgi:uncharacterized membrane protein YdjX (TVP38/TMEM64 family)
MDRYQTILHFPKRRTSNVKCKVATLLCIAVIGCALVPLTLRGWAIEIASTTLFEMKGMGVVGACGYIVLQFFVSATGILPASLLGVAAGIIYGMLWGSALAALGTIAGAVAGFHLGRHGLRKLCFLPQRLERQLQTAESYVVADGWKLVFLLRLSPLMPFAATSIALGASGIGERNYLIGTLASLPSLLGYVYAGSLLNGETSLTSPELHTMLAWGLAIGSIASVTVATRFILHLSR